MKRLTVKQRKDTKSSSTPLLDVREYSANYPLELEDLLKAVPGKHANDINRPILKVQKPDEAIHIDMLDLLFWLKKNKPELFNFVYNNNEELETEILMVQIKNPNRKYPNKLYRTIAVHNLRKTPKNVEVLANRKGEIITYTENKNFNNDTLLNNFKVIKADKEKIDLQYGYLGEFGINETITITIRFW